MAILTETVVRRRPRRPRGFGLTPKEQDNARVAIHALRRRYGTWQAVALAMGVGLKTVKNALGPTRRPTAGLVLRVARAAGVPVEDVLAGKYPRPGACPLCGHVARER